MTKPLLTKLDWKLLELLQKDGRMSISDLAKQVNRSRSNVSEHLEKLQDSGILTGISAKVDMSKLGFGISAFVRLQTSSSKLFDIINSITTLPEVVECHVLTGTDLFIIRLYARDMDHLRELVDGFTLIGATQTEIIFSTQKGELVIDEKLRKVAD